MIVLDASAALELLLQTAKGEQIAAVALAPEERLHAPHLIDVEVTQTLRRLTQSQSLSLHRAEVALTDFGLLAIERHDHRDLVHRVWQLRDAMTAYDGMYVALAEALEAPLLTCDGKLSRAHGHRARITAL